jgi:hypothetical protein
MLTELSGKGGCLCQPAKAGQLRCPLIIRPTSEDVLTGHVFQALQIINPYWWLADLLNTALAAPRFRRQVYRHLKIALWKNRPYYPRELLPWPEGSTQVDATITWENPATTVFIEVKYGADLATTTARATAEHGYPADQLIRNLRVGLLECGYFDRDQLFHPHPRDFVLLLLAPEPGHPLIARYRDLDQLRAAIPHSNRLQGLPQVPFLGELSYRALSALLRRQRRWFTRPERDLVDLLVTYLDWKRSPAPK